MLVAGFPAGSWGTNCYVLAPGRGQECLVIDPGQDAVAGVEDVVRENGLRPVAVVLTHGHLDHTWSVVPVCGAHGVPAYVHPDDRSMISDPLPWLRPETREALSGVLTGGRFDFAEPEDVRELADGAVLELAGLRLVVNHAPGHTRGSVTFRTERDGAEPPVLFSGDLLFRDGVGRSDLPGGDPDVLLESLARVCLPLDDDTVVLAGHGADTTIGRERTSNRFLREAAAGGSGLAAPGRGL